MLCLRRTNEKKLLNYANSLDYATAAVEEFLFGSGEFNHTVFDSINSVVRADSGAHARHNLAAALADDDVADNGLLAGKKLHA